MEIKIIQEDFFLGGVVDANLYREGLKKGRELSMTLEVNKLKYFVYVPELLNILTSKKIPLLNGEIADGTVFAQDYVTGYNSGIEYFKNEFPEVHLMVNADQYFSSLHYCYFHQAPNFTKNNGWIHWINSYPTTLNSKQIEEYGFCAGIKFCINQLKRKNPTLFKKFIKCDHNLPPQQAETKTDKLKAELGKHGFFELIKVKQLSEQKKQSLVELISKNGLPYSIAMFDYLGFLKHLENEHFKTKYKLNKGVSTWFNSDKDGRAVKGNISSLSDYSAENKSKYTAHTHKETVKKDYQKLK